MATLWVATPIALPAQDPNTLTQPTLTASATTTTQTTTSTQPETILPATPDTRAPAIVAPAPEPINPGYSGAADDPAKPVVVRVISPKPDEIINSSTADIFFSVDNYTLAEGGNRIHVIINNNDPIALHDLRAPLTLKELPEGGQTIRVFAVQPDGHSLPNPEAFAMVRFYMRKKNFQNFTAPASPYLTVNLPISGIVDVEDGGRVWFDFRAANVTLSPKGYKVHYKINNIEGTITEAKTVFWEGMKPGRYELITELVDANNAPVIGVFNQVHRTFDVRTAVKALPAEPDAPVTNQKPSAADQQPRRALPAD